MDSASQRGYHQSMFARVVGYIACAVVAVVTIACGGTAAAPTPLPDQSGCSFTVSPASFNVDATTISSDVQVTASASGCSWTAAGNVAFIQTSSAGGIGSATVTLVFSQNTGAARTGTATVAGHTITVNQGASTAPTPLTGTWRGTWTWTGIDTNGCTNTDSGTLSMTLTQTASAFSGTTTTTGVQTRDANCVLTSTGTSSGTVFGTISGNDVILSFFISGTDSATQHEGSATLSGTTLTGTFPRAGSGDANGSGSFTVTKQ